MSSITIINNTPEDLRVALYFRPRGATLEPLIEPFPWKILDIPRDDGSTSIAFTFDFTILARYSADPDHPDALSKETNALTAGESTALFTIDAAPAESGVAVLTQRFDKLIVNEIRVVNNYPLGCEVTFFKELSPLMPPKVIWPGGTLVTDLRGSFAIAIVDESYTGEKVVTLNETPAEFGSQLTITGSKWKGYAITAKTS